MMKDELFKKAWLFCYIAAGKNIGFDIRLANSEKKAVSEKQEKRESA